MFERNEIANLVQRLTVLLGNDASQTVTFISAHAQEGTSSIARACAEALGEETGRDVLLIDAGPLDRARFVTDGISPSQGLAGNYADDGGKPHDAIHKIDQHLYLARWQGENDSRTSGSRALHAAAFWDSLRQDYPLILIDAPSLQSGGEGIAFAARSDATILVIEAETTRQAVVENLRDTLTNAGAKVVGTILNRRRHYIPDEVYARM